jgi:hypothetical protein
MSPFFVPPAKPTSVMIAILYPAITVCPMTPEETNTYRRRSFYAVILNITPCFFNLQW